MQVTAVSSAEELTVEVLATHYPRATRPLLRANMVASLDGMASVGGRSGPLSGETDRRIFRFLRAGASAVLVGARTAIAESYRESPGFSGDLAEYRRQCALPKALRIVVASRSQERPAQLPGFEHLSLAPETSPGEVLKRLDIEGPAVLLCEGGPTLLSELARADAIDEYCITTSFSLVGSGDAPLLPGRLKALRPLIGTSAIITAEAAHFRLVRPPN